MIAEGFVERRKVAGTSIPAVNSVGTGQRAGTLGAVVGAEVEAGR